MKVDVRNIDMFQDEEDCVEFVKKEKNKKRKVPNEFKKNDNKKMNKPKRINDN